MPDTVNAVFAGDGLLPHGQCILWTPGLVWLHVVSDTLIAISYYSIPLALLYFVRKRRDLPFNWMFVLFAAFIVGCGTTHVMAIWTIWKPEYWLDGAIKGLTAGVSLVTACLLWPLIPKAVSLPSPTQLEAANKELRTEIIERKRVEDALHRSQEQLRQIWNSGPTMMFIKDIQGRYADINPQFLKLTTLSRDQILGKTDADIFPSQQAASFHANDAKVLEAGLPMEFEEVALHADGLHTSIVYKFPLRDREGRVYAIGGVVTDITERKQVETIRRQHLERVMAAQEEERARIARELHDETGQSLMALLFGLRALEKSLASETAKKQAHDLGQMTKASITNIKRMALGLRPSLLDDLGLEAALTRLGDDFTSTNKIPIGVQVNGLDGTRLPPEIESALYRIAQEALTNIAKHASARMVSAIVTLTPSHVRMIVEDNGRGFDAEGFIRSESAKRHLGLQGMRERVALLNGTLEIESAPGTGTTVYVQIPIRHATA